MSEPQPAASTLICDACDGTGRHFHFASRPCSICRGTGQIEIPLEKAA